MIEIIPAIDIIDGKCVRLSKGGATGRKDIANNRFRGRNKIGRGSYHSFRQRSTDGNCRQYSSQESSTVRKMAEQIRSRTDNPGSRRKRQQNSY